MLMYYVIYAVQEKEDAMKVKAIVTAAVLK